MTKILVTGALGFLGRAIIKELAKYSNDFEITVIVRTNQLQKAQDLPNVQKIITSEDIFEETIDRWRDIAREIDIVIHAAWYTNPSDYLFSNENNLCLLGSLRMALGLASSNCKKVIAIGTCLEYDLSKGVITVDTELKPQCNYAHAKLSLYYGLNSILSSNDTEFCWARVFYLHGEGEHPNKLASYIKNCAENNTTANLTDGNQIRDYLHVDEAAKKIVKIARSEITGPVNICSGIPITVRQFAERVATELNCLDLLRFGKRPSNFLDPICVVGVPSI